MTENTEPVVAEAPRPRGVLRAISLGVSGVVLVATLLLATVAVIVPALTGAQSYTVLTRSMEPGLPPGTYLVVKPVSVDDLQAGDVITYQLESGKPEVVTHRIISVSVSSDGERRFITQGDANAVADPDPVRPVQIRGALWYAVPFVGWLTGLRSDSASSMWIPAVAGLIFLYAAVMFGSWVNERLRRPRPQDLDPHTEDQPPAVTTSRTGHSWI